MRKGMVRRLGAVVLTSALVVGSATAQEEVDERIHEAIFDLTADDADKRAAAIDVIALHAPASFEALLRALPDPEQHEGWAAALAAAEKAGPEIVLREVEATRSTGGAAAGPVVEQYLRDVRARWADSPVVTVATTEATLPDPSRVPPGVALPIGSELPSDLAWGEYPARPVKNGGLHIATKDPERFDLKLRRGEWRALELGSARWPRRLMVFDRGGRWMVASAALRQGEARGTRVELLDVDGDGEFGGENDLVAVDGGAFLRVGSTTHVWAFGVRTAFRVGREDGGVVVELAPMPEPEGPGRDVPTWAWVNAWRAGVGLGPQPLDRPRSLACKEHHDYWERNGFSAHDQDPRKPGASRTGATAGRRSSVWQQPDPVRLADAISRNILHRRSLIGMESEGLGVAGGSAGSLLWGGRRDRRDARSPLVVPGPGQRNVPTLLLAEVPTPKDDPDFYKRSRGYPIGVHFEGAFGALSDVSLTLESAENGKALRGIQFTPESPYHPSYNANEAVFVSDSVLRGNTWYLARFRATDDDGPFEVSWWFSTGDGRFPSRTGRR